MNLVDRIFLLLQEQDKKQADFARFLDVRVATISEWKRGRCSPSIAILPRIAEYLGVSIDYLITGNEHTPSPSQTINQGVIGDNNENNAVTIGGNGVTLSEFEKELLRLYSSLDTRRKNALLTVAYNLEKEMSEES